MTSQFLDSLFNFLRTSFLLFHLVIFYYLIFWNSKINLQIQKKTAHYFFIIIFLNVILNFIIFFKGSSGEVYIFLIAVNTAVIGAVLFYGYKSTLNFKIYYLLFPIILVAILIFKKDNLFIFLGLFFISISYFHIYSKEKFSKFKPSRVTPLFIKKGMFLPFIFFGLYTLALSCYILRQSIFCNIFSTVFVFLSLTFRVNAIYKGRFKTYIFYILLSTIIFSVLSYCFSEYIEAIKKTAISSKKTTLERLSLEIKEKINAYSNFIRILTYSGDIKRHIKNGGNELNNYLSYLNHSLDTALIFFADKNGKIQACSVEYRKIMLQQDISFRKYFKESMDGKLAISMARGIYTLRDDLRISYPVYEGNRIIGVLVFQIDIINDLKKYLNIENAFIMHSSGAVLAGKPDLRNKLILNPAQDDLNKIYKEYIFAKDRITKSDFRQIGSDIFEDSVHKQWLLLREEFMPDWFIASFLDSSMYNRYQDLFYITVFLFVFISHSFAVKYLEKLRDIFINLAKESEEKKLALDAMNVGVIYTDFLGKIKYLNKEAKRLTGASDQEAISRSLNELFTLKEHVNSAYKILQSKSGNVSIVYNEKPIVIDNIKFGDLIIIQDASEIIQRNELTKKLETMDAIAQISAGITHDFNNYLTVLTGNLSLLKGKDVTKSMNNTEMIEKMLETTKIMKQIVEQLSDLSPDLGLKREKISIDEIVKNSAIFVLNNTKIKLTIESEPSLFPVYANSAQLYRLFQNLIINSKQAMDNEGNITITLQNYINNGKLKDLPAAKYVYIEITDNGPGIPEEYIDKIFNPFFTMKKGGRGLGLSIVKSIIEKLDGKIELESKSGFGTTFKIYIPASD